MRICVFGIGAVGGLVLARLTRSGVDASGFARGENLAAVRARGLRLVDHEGMEHLVKPVHVTDDAEYLGAQDVVFLALKANRIIDAVDRIRPLIGPQTTVVTAVNGIPWWYFHGLPGDWSAKHLEMVDPGGGVWNALGPERALGCVVYLGASVPRPGVIFHTRHNRLVLGEPDGSMSERSKALSDALEGAGFEAPVVPDIRRAVWHKVWGNAWANTISVITRATIDIMCEDPHLHDPLRAMMAEIRDVAGHCGVAIEDDIDQRISDSARLGAFKSSTLQDFERGRAVEVDAILGAVMELARETGEPTPLIDMVYALTRLTARTAGCYQAP